MFHAIAPVIVIGAFIYIVIVFIRIAEFIESVRRVGLEETLKEVNKDIPYGQKDDKDRRK